MGRRIFYSDEMRVAYAARFAAELAETLYEAGITHRELAQELGVAHSTVDSWTRIADPKVPGEHNLHRLSEFLEKRKPGSGARIVAVPGQPIGRSFVDASPLDVADSRSREWRKETATPGAVKEETYLQVGSAPASPSNLPAALTPFVGRKDEIADVGRLLAKVRQLTLVGAGGIGKTRLALEIARGLDCYPDGVWLVELDALQDPDLIPTTIAQAIPSVQHRGSLSTDTLAAYIGDKHIMLVLDNCEHLIEACAQVSETLLQNCPKVDILATSREALSCSGETVWQVRTLSIPHSQGSRKPGSDRSGAAEFCARVAESESGQLFVARASARQASFELAPQNAPHVAEICMRLDGIPLALELAAARVSAMSVEEIAQRLDACLQLLTYGRRTRLPRQQALRASLEWSYDLLKAPERVLFRRLGVFVGGWTLDAAEGVCAGDGLSTYGVLNNLMQLADKSLVLAEQVRQGHQGNTSGGTRGGTHYRFLEPVRQYALEKLADSGEAESVSLRQAQFFTALVERASADFYDRTSALGLALVLTELDNIRAVLAWTIDSRQDPVYRRALEDDCPEMNAIDGSNTKEAEAELGLRMVGALGSYWAWSGELTEAMAWTEKALAQSDASWRTATRARALLSLAGLAVQHGRFAGLEEWLAESESIWREVGDRSGLAQTLSTTGVMLLNNRRLEAGRAAFAESVALAEEIGDRNILAFTLFAWGTHETEVGDLETACTCLQRSVEVCEANGNGAFRTVPMVSLARVSWLRGDYEVAQKIVEEALVLRIKDGGEWPIAGALNSLADIVRCRGDYARAISLANQSLLIFRKLGDKSSTAWALYTLGHAVRQSGDHVQAIQCWRESLEIDRELGKDRDTITCLAALACGYFLAGQLSRAATLFGSADALLNRGSVRWSPYDEKTYYRYHTETQSAQSDELFALHWHRGQGMQEVEAVSFALSSP